MTRPVVFLGIGDVVLAVGSWLVERGRRCVVVTTPEQARKAGEGGDLGDAARRAGIDLVVGADAPAPAALAGLAEEPLLISVGAPWLLDGAYLDAIGAPVLNLHGTHLPRGRGGTLYSWHIMTGQRTGMCLLHRMTRRLDDGPVVAFLEFLFPAACRKPIDYIREHGARNVAFLKGFLGDAAAGRHRAEAAPPLYLASYWPRLRADVNGWIDWGWTALELERFITAFDDPYGGARTRHRGRPVVLRDVWAQGPGEPTHPFQHGIVFRKGPSWLHVAARDGELLVGGITDGRGRGVAVKVGDRLWSRPEDLADGRRRVVKDGGQLGIQADADGA